MYEKIIPSRKFAEVAGEEKTADGRVSEGTKEPCGYTVCLCVHTYVIYTCMNIHMQYRYICVYTRQSNVVCVSHDTGYDNEIFFVRHKKNVSAARDAENPASGHGPLLSDARVHSVVDNEDASLRTYLLSSVEQNHRIFFRASHATICI